MIQRAAVSTLVCLALLARVAAAHPMHRHHDKLPTTPPPAPTLQQILDGLVVSGPAIDASAPIDVQLWTNSAAPMTAQVVVNYSPNSDHIFFGMYPADDPNNHAFVLRGNVTPADLATVLFNEDGSITVHGGFKNKQSSGFDGPFGFFVSNSPAQRKCDSDSESGSVFLFTQDDLNGGPRALVFQGNGLTTLKLPGLAPGLFLPNQFLIAWETGLGDANDGKFNDFLVLVSNIVPVTVPEPAFAFLLGISSLAVICVRRARSD